MQPPPAGKRSLLSLSFKVLIPVALMLLLFIYFSYFVVFAEISFLTRQFFVLLLAVPVVSTVFCFYVYQQASAIDRQRQRAEGINRVLIQISTAASSTFDLDALYRSIHRSLGEIIDVSNFFIALYDRKRMRSHSPIIATEWIQPIRRSEASTAQAPLQPRSSGRRKPCWRPGKRSSNGPPPRDSRRWVRRRPCGSVSR